MTVALYQTFIVVTLAMLRLFGRKALLIGAISWSALSLINLFYPPLIAFQLAVVWVTFGLLGSTGRPIPKTSDAVGSSAFAQPVQQPTPSRAATALKISPAPSSEHEVAELWGSDAQKFDPAIAGLLLQQTAIFDLEKELIIYFLGRANAHRNHESFLRTADPGMTKNYYAEWNRRPRQSSLSAEPVSQHAKLIPLTENPPVISDDELQGVLEKAWTDAAAAQAEYLDEISGQLNADKFLRLSFMNSALLNSADAVLHRMKLDPFKDIKTNARVQAWFSEYNQVSSDENPEDLKAAIAAVEVSETIRTQHPAQSSASAIRQIATNRNVPNLVHFTSADNLASILKYGLVPLDLAETIGIKPLVNDSLRLDRRRHATSTSIAFPNASMFWKYRQENPSARWVVLGIDPSVMWSRSCYFCKHNAADAKMIRMAADDLTTPEAFAGMFDDLGGMLTREAQNLMPFDPTDPQAEVMVLGVIPPDAITSVTFDDPDVAAKMRSIVAGRKVEIHERTRGLFAQRGYARMRRGTF